MFKKTMVFSLAIVLVLMGLCSMASAAQNVANTSQKGSLLVFPLVYTMGDWETIIVVANDNTAGMWVKCIWMDGNQTQWNLEFPLTANQPAWFRASDGIGSQSVNGFGENQGELKCFAITFPVNDGAPEQQIAWNHLYGSAIVFNAKDALAFEYNAWAFSARNVTTNTAMGPPGVMTLTGATTGAVYDACPAYQVFNFFAKGASLRDAPAPALPYMKAGTSSLALSPCYQDLRQDRNPVCTKAKFDIWNENERKYTGAYRCVKCWYEGELDRIDSYAPYPYSENYEVTPKPAGFGGAFFLYDTLHTNLGRFRVTGISGANVCAGVFFDPITGDDLCPRAANPDTGYLGQIAVPFLGVRSTEVAFNTNTTPPPTDAVLATTGATAGSWVVPAGSPVPQILWDSAEGPVQAPGK